MKLAQFKVLKEAKKNEKSPSHSSEDSRSGSISTLSIIPPSLISLDSYETNYRSRDEHRLLKKKVKDEMREFRHCREDYEKLCHRYELCQSAMSIIIDLIQIGVMVGSSVVSVWFEDLSSKVYICKII